MLLQLVGGIDEEGTNLSFNTASGRCCCTQSTIVRPKHHLEVSIPQAVGAVATLKKRLLLVLHQVVSIPQAVGAVATEDVLDILEDVQRFQYRKR